MNIKFLFLVASFGVATCFLTAQEAQRPPGPDAGSGAPRLHLLSRDAEQTLNLTEEQRKQMAAIEADAKTRIEALLTPEQKEKMGAMRPGSQPRPQRGRGDGSGRNRPVSEDLQSVAPAKMLDVGTSSPDTARQAGERAASSSAPLPPGVTRVPVEFSGGHETVPVDHGRPVALVAAALGVQDEVFREAFSHVHPAGPGSGGPTEAEARANKQALMSRLAQYGVTDERLNMVSNFYRYPPGSRNLWRNKPASANALVKDGAVVGYEITDGGYGYTTPPTVRVPGMDGVMAKVQLSYGKDFESNGTVSAITIAETK
jgi:Spy/CpxP family protein refolding chaperone